MPTAPSPHVAKASPHVAKAVMVMAGLSIVDAAGRLDPPVHSVTLGRWLNRRDPMPARRRAQLAALLEVEEADLFEPDAPRPRQEMTR